jgi:hypothetical protein
MALAGEIAIDDGTSARIGSPEPGAVGLDAKGSKPKAPASIPESVVTFASQNMGQRVGDGECFALADSALRSAGAKSAASYGTIVPDADYVWGTEVSLPGLKPGDIIQFRDYRYRKLVVKEDDKNIDEKESSEDRPHHTAIVERVGADGVVTVLEQNSPQGSAVHRTTLYFKNSESESGGQKTKVTVTGAFWFYRPQPR